MCIYIYIYIDRERKRERERETELERERVVYIILCYLIFITLSFKGGFWGNEGNMAGFASQGLVLCVYIYIYIEREREIDRCIHVNKITNIYI